jgi:hypothetical protein
MLENTKSETDHSIIEPNQGHGRLKIVAAGLSVGAGLAYLLSKVLRGRSSRASQQSHQSVSDNVVDDRGTRQQEAATILRNLRDRAFEASDEKLAIALGRPLEEVAAWHAGIEVIDDDVVMKARGIAMHRGVHVE